MKKGYIYFLTNINHKTIYVGVTSDLVRRIYQHKQKLVSGFTKKYNLVKLVYFETYYSIEDAIVREKQIKAGSRKKKEELIESRNSGWRDLYKDIL